MNFKIPHSALYFGMGINASLFFLGIALDRIDMSLLAVLSGMLCAFPIIFKQEEE